MKMPKQHPKMSQKNAQHGSKIGPTWGHDGLQNRLGPAQERRKNDTENDTEKEAQKDTKKRQKKNLTDNEREARLHVKTWEELKSEMRTVGYVKQAHEHKWVITTS